MKRTLVVFTSQGGPQLNTNPGLLSGSCETPVTARPGPAHAAAPAAPARHRTVPRPRALGARASTKQSTPGPRPRNRSLSGANRSPGCLSHLRDDRHNDGAVLQLPDALAAVEHEVGQRLAGRPRVRMLNTASWSTKRCHKPCQRTTGIASRVSCSLTLLSPASSLPPPNLSYRVEELPFLGIHGEVSNLDAP